MPSPESAVEWWAAKLKSEGLSVVEREGFEITPKARALYVGLNCDYHALAALIIFTEGYET